MTFLTFATTTGWSLADGFGCASLGLPGVCDNNCAKVAKHPTQLDGIILTGTYQSILADMKRIYGCVQAAIVLLGNAGGENRFMVELQQLLTCPIVGGGAAIDSATGRSALITGGGEAAVFLITDDRFTYQTETKCIHENIIETCYLDLLDPRTIRKINGTDAKTYLDDKKRTLGIALSDFEHITLSDLNHVNAHLSCVDGVIKSGRDLQEEMLLRYVEHDKVFEAMRSFYDDPDAIVFGCAGLSGLLDKPLQTGSLGLFLFGEVCATDTGSEFGNLMLSKLRIIPK